MCSEWTGTPRAAGGAGHPVPRVDIPHAGLAYACQDCVASFQVDPTDPFDAHGKYLDHLEVHDGDHELDEIEYHHGPGDEDPTDSCSCSCSWIDDPQCEYHHGPGAGY